MVGREERALVARDGALGGEGIHRLGSRDARDRVHRERRHLALRQGADELTVHEGLEERDEHLSFAEPRHLAVARHLHLRDRIGPGEGVFDEPRARFLVGRVEETGLEARAGLDEDLDAGLHEPLRRIGHKCHSPLARSGLLGDADLHAARSLESCRGRMAR